MKARIMNILSHRRTGAAARWVLGAAVGFLLSRVDILGGIMPLGGAWMAAVGFAGWPVTPAMLGVLAGTLSIGRGMTYLTVLLPPSLLYFAVLITRRTGWRPGVGMGAWLLLAARLALRPFKMLLIYDMLRFVIECLLAVGGYFALYYALCAVNRRLKFDDQRQIMCFCAAAGMLLLSLGDISLFGFSPRYFFAALITVWAAWAGGAATGAACGLGVGMVLSLGGVDVTIAAALGAGGLIAGAFQGVGPVFCALGFLLGDVIMTAWTTLFAQPAIPFLESALAGLTLAALPPKWAKAASARIMPSTLERERQREMKLDTLRRRVVGQIDGFSQCLEALSGVFAETAVSEAGTMEEVGPLLEAVADEACADCPLCKQCWEDEFFLTYRHFIKTLSAPGKRRVIVEDDFPSEFRVKCRNFDAVMASLRTVYGLFRIKTGYRKRIDDSRYLVGRQLKGVGQVMGQLSGQLNLQIRFDDDAGHLARQALEDAGVGVRSVVAQETAAGLVINAMVRGCGGRRKCRQLEGTLSRALGRPLRKAPNVCRADGNCALCFKQANVMHVSCAGNQLARDTGLCGDACTHVPLDDGYLLAISDGMGTGARAAMESQV